MGSRPPTTLVLCRHGQSEGNRDQRFGGHGPAPLTELGRAQARATGVRLRADGAAVLYSSDLPRAQQTAALIGEQLRLTPRLVPALRERSVGIFTGLRFEEAQLRFPDAFQALLRREPDAAPPEGESYLQCYARATAFLEQAMHDHPGQRIVVVSHHLTLYLIVLHILGVQYGAGGRHVYVHMSNCGLHRFERYEDGAWQVLALNDMSHLSDVAPDTVLR